MIRRFLVCYLVLALFVISIAPRVEASFSPSETLAAAVVSRAGDVEKIRTTLENKLVAQRLQDLGYSVEEVMGRLSEMTDSQIHSFAQQLDQVKVGGDALGVIIAVLVIIVLVIVILRLTGHRVAVR